MLPNLPFQATLSLRGLRQAYGTFIGLAELVFNAALMIACWRIAAVAYERGIDAAQRAGLPPRTIEGVVGLATSPYLLDYLTQWATAVVALPVAGLFAFTALEGTWWVLKRLGRPF